MIKPQDVMLLLKMMANPYITYSQSEIAKQLCYSQSSVNDGLKRLEEVMLIRHSNPDIFKNEEISVKPDYILNHLHIRKFLEYTPKYWFVAKRGPVTRGIKTCSDCVWPHEDGTVISYSIQPIYKSVPDSLLKYPDFDFYELLKKLDKNRLKVEETKKLDLDEFWDAYYPHATHEKIQEMWSKECSKRYHDTDKIYEELKSVDFTKGEQHAV